MLATFDLRLFDWTGILIKLGGHAILVVLQVVLGPLNGTKVPPALLPDDFILNTSPSRCNENVVLRLILAHKGSRCFRPVLLIVFEKLSDSVALSAGLIQRHFEELVVLHGVFDL